MAKKPVYRYVKVGRIDKRLVVTSIKTQQRWLPVFLDYLNYLSIPSKELQSNRRVPLADILYEAQRRILKEICDGLDKGIHDFKCLKARQLGATSITLAIDLFWLSVHDNLQGALVTDTEPNREKFRVLIEQYIKSLPQSLRVGIRRHNRNLLELENGSCLDYLVAGTKRGNTTLGQSRAINFLHATEVGSWASDEGIASLKASLAQKHPHRLYIWESTAHGYNHWHDLWQDATNDEISQKAFFVGWYLKGGYCFEEGSKEYAHYWDGQMDDQEIALCQEVKQRFKVNITAGQIAWHRWYRTTQLPNEDLMNQNFPWTPEQAFILSGHSFFPLRRVSDNIKHIKETKTPFKGYRYHMGENFLATEIEQVARPHEAELRVWEEPVPNARYVMGVDPAYGRSDNDNHAIQVCRCYADKLEQVAEYATSVPETYQLAWVMAHLAGAYKDVIINAELQGPGAALMPALKHLRQLFDLGYLKQEQIEGSPGQQEIFNSVRWYLYHRPDSMAGNYVYNFQTNSNTKPPMMNQLRDNYALGIIEVRSLPLLWEMEHVVQEGFEIGASGHNRDDRTFALGLANKAYVDWLRGPMLLDGLTYNAVHSKNDKGDTVAPQASIMPNIVASFFARKNAEREERDVTEAWHRAGVIE